MNMRILCFYTPDSYSFVGGSFCCVWCYVWKKVSSWNLMTCFLSLGTRSSVATRTLKTCMQISNTSFIQILGSISLNLIHLCSHNNNDDDDNSLCNKNWHRWSYPQLEYFNLEVNPRFVRGSMHLRSLESWILNEGSMHLRSHCLFWTSRSRCPIL